MQRAWEISLRGTLKKKCSATKLHRKRECSSTGFYPSVGVLPPPTFAAPPKNWVGHASPVPPLSVDHILEKSISNSF